MANVDDTCWEGRTWISSNGSSGQLTKKSFRLLSYNVLSDYKTSFLHHTTMKNWDVRRIRLLEEIKTYNIDIICLQDIDHYQDWWRPQLTLLGYDTVYKQRTQIKNFHYEGVLIAFRRDTFQMFKSVTFELNNAVMNEDRGRAFMERSKTDDIGVIVFLQPWNQDCVNSALCICNTMLSDESVNSDIRMAQAQYVARQIELANMEFHVPVLLAVSMYDTPSSLAYTLLSTGRIPLAGQVPKRCRAPEGIATCRGSVLLKWFPPPSSVADFPILSYRISWRPGGSQVLAFRAEIEIGVGDCVKYAEKIDENRNIRMVALEEREYTISGLVSDVPYEFRIAAVNEVGAGIWSEESAPIVMNNPERAPAMPELRQFANIIQLNETREQILMQRDDTNLNASERVDAMSSQTQLTPRNLEGNINPFVARSRILPYETNPRSGWKASLSGTADHRINEILNKESVLNKSVLRDRTGFKNKALGHYSDIDQVDEQHLQNNVNTGINNIPAVGMKLKVPKFKLDAKKRNDEEDDLEDARVHDKNAILLDGREVLDTLGVPNKRQVHDLSLSSAYVGYSLSGEPLYTASYPSEKNKIGTECMDYIFYSTGTLQADKLLSLPLLSQLRTGERSQASCVREDVSHKYAFPISIESFDNPIKKLYEEINMKKFIDDSSSTSSSNRDLLGPDIQLGEEIPQSVIIDAKRYLKHALAKSRIAGNNPISSNTNTPSTATMNNKNKAVAAPSASSSGLWGGKWVAPPTHNHQRSSYWLPSDTFASSHLALGAEFSMNDSLLCTQWK